MGLHFKTCYRAVSSRGRSLRRMVHHRRDLDRHLLSPVPGHDPEATNVRFFPTAAARRGRASVCKRCLPMPAPAHPSGTSEVTSLRRAMRLIFGRRRRSGRVAGLAAASAFQRAAHHTGLPVEELGAGPQAIARAQRAERRAL